MLRRRAIMGAGGGKKEPIFRIDFTDGLNPQINKQNVTVSKSGTVTISNGKATFDYSAMLKFTPNFNALERTIHIKFKPTYIGSSTKIFADGSDNGISDIYTGSSTKQATICGSGGGNDVVYFRNSFAKNNSYDIILVLSEGEARYYRNKTLETTTTLTHALTQPDLGYTRLASTQGSMAYGFTGDITLFEVFGHALTDAEIALLD